MSDIEPSESKIQLEPFLYNQPTAESGMVSLGALANALREIILPVGSIVDSMLDEATFQAQNEADPVRWILADGRDVTGTAYTALTGNANVPDLRGVFRRGKNYTRSTATGNPDGDLAVGTYTADKFKAHAHSVTDPGHTHAYQTNADSQFASSGGDFSAMKAPGIFNTGNSTIGVTINDNGVNETAPRDVTVNTFIRVN